MGPKQQPDTAQVLHAFVSRLASCSSSVDDIVQQSSFGRKAGTKKRTRTPASGRDECYKVTCPGAKQLPCFLESSGSGCKAATFSLPCLDFTERKNKFSSKTPSSTAGASGDISYPNIVRLLRFNKLDISLASPTAHANFISTFRTLLDAELRRTARALLQRSLMASRSKAESSGEGGGMDEATVLAHAHAIRILYPNILEDLNGSSSDSSGDEEDKVEERPYEIKAAVTNWVTSNGSTSTCPPPNNKAPMPSPFSKKTVTQPIVFEAVMDLEVASSDETTALTRFTSRLSSAGSITATFSRSMRLETATIHLDSDDLRAVLNAKVREVVQEVVTAIVVGHRHPTPTLLSTRAVSVDDNSSSEDDNSSSEDDEENADDEHCPQQPPDVVPHTTAAFETNDDLDRKMMPPPPNRPPRKIVFQRSNHQHNHKRHTQAHVTEALDDESTIYHRSKRARMVSTPRPRMAISA